MPRLSIDPQPATFPEFQRVEVSADGLGRYDVLVALPDGYTESTTRHPVIYLTDGPHWFWSVIGIMRFLGVGGLVPQAIIVGVGYPSDEGSVGWAVRRHYDFTPPWDMTDELGAMSKDALTQYAASVGRPDLEVRAGGAERFLGFLRDELDPAIRDAYRCDDSKPTLVGASSGGAFVLYAMVSGASPFDKYICISPAAAVANDRLYELEAGYAGSHKDLAARLFLCAGTEEMSGRPTALAGIASGVARFTELFVVRGYPSLVVKSQIMEGEAHHTIFPRALMHGLLHVFSLPQAVGPVASR